MVWGMGFVRGMAVTMKNAFRGPVTVNYPEERLELPDRARWAVGVVLDEDGAPLCTACMNCVRECPDDVLALDVTTDEDKNKTVVRFTYELGACMFCGLCVEKCPFGALAMTHDYELATTDTAALSRILLADVAAAKPVRKKTSPDAASEPDAADGGGGDDA